ncbi:MAG: zinc-binding alcohol dehydrogenase [Clostridia bacterium]|nr:zinc-binding alcohol dehydrogenase [Clostridia bacterium]
MKIKSIVFTEPYRAELIENEFQEDISGKKVLVKTEVSTVSPGTERAVITDAPNCGGYKNHVFPRKSGYSSAGVVEKVGEDVRTVKPGDRVIVFWGSHSSYNAVPESHVVKITDDIPFDEAAVVFISTFSLAAIRKCRIEIGESGLVMGCGLLGQFAVKLMRAAGAAPIIACDTVDSRLNEAKSAGADFIFNALDPDFAKKVKEVSQGGVNVAVEVTGVGAGLDEALDCMARFGRIALLGCTRESNFNIDYYTKIHSPGITLIGAHTKARPAFDSSPGWFTQPDDIRSVLRLISMGRVVFSDLIKERKYSPSECGMLYDKIINDRHFPTLVQFDWNLL